MDVGRGTDTLAIFLATAVLGAGVYVLGFYLLLTWNPWFWVWLMTLSGGAAALYLQISALPFTALRRQERITVLVLTIGYAATLGYLSLSLLAA